MDRTGYLINQKNTTLGEKININFTVIGIVLLILHISTLKSFIPFQLSILLLIASIFVLLFSKLLLCKQGIIITRVDIMWSMFLILFIMNITFNNLISRSTLFDILVYSIAVLFLILGKVRVEYYKYPFKFIKYVGIIYAFSAILQYLFTDIYISYVLPIFASNEQETVLQLLRSDAYTGFANQTAHLAGYVLSSIGIIIFLNWKTKLSTRVVSLIFLAILFIGLFLSAKRAHLIFTIVALLLTFIFSLNNKRFVENVVKLIITLMTVIFFVIILYNSINFKDDSVIVSFANELESTIQGLIEGEDVSNGRSVLFAHAWEQFKNNPIIGIGWKEFMNNSLGLIRNDMGSHPHNIYLQILSEFGLVGFIFFFTPVMYLYYKTFQTIRFLTTHKKLLIQWRAGVQFSFFIQTFFLLYGLTGNPITDYNFLLLYFFACSISLSALVNLNKSEVLTSEKEISR